MADIEKVIKELNECIEHIRKNKFYKIPCWGNCQIAMIDALKLLKEQEPIMIKTVMINGSGKNGRCQNCLMMLNEMDYPNFCGNCGKAVKWE